MSLYQLKVYKGTEKFGFCYEAVLFAERDLVFGHLLQEDIYFTNKLVAAVPVIKITAPKISTGGRTHIIRVECITGKKTGAAPFRGCIVGFIRIL
jgi:hypothetical protein